MALILGNTLAMGLRERTSEMGAMRAIGFPWRSVLGSFLVESLVLAIIGAAAGCLFASALSAVSFSP
jgi:putative ABC transport system permease protein